MEKEITYITCLFDIGRKTDDRLSNFNNYFTWTNELLQYNINMVFYTTQDIHDKLTYIPRPNLKFIMMDSMPNFDKIDDIKNAWKNFKGKNKEKDTAEFAALTHGKFDLIYDAMIRNIYHTEFFYWIDAALFKVVTKKNLLLSINTYNKIRIMLIYYYRPEYVNTDEFLLDSRSCCAAGFFGGPILLMKQFCELMFNERNITLNKNIYGLEQEYMYRIYTNYPDLFDAKVGYFSTLFETISDHHQFPHKLYLLYKQRNPDF